MAKRASQLLQSSSGEALLCVFPMKDKLHFHGRMSSGHHVALGGERVQVISAGVVTGAGRWGRYSAQRAQAPRPAAVRTAQILLQSSLLV